MPLSSHRERHRIILLPGKATLAETRNISATADQDGRVEIAGANDITSIQAQTRTKGRAEIDAAIACEGGVLELERAVIDLDAHALIVHHLDRPWHRTDKLRTSMLADLYTVARVIPDHRGHRSP